MRGITLLLLATLGGATASAQWVAVHATKQVTEVVTRTSSNVAPETTVTTSDFFRSTTGSELTQTSVSSSNHLLTSRTATLFDNEGLAVYSLDYAGKKAYQTRKLTSAKIYNPRADAEKNALGHETIEGIDCTILPIRRPIGNGEMKLVGRVWMATKYDLPVRTEFVIDNPGASTRITTALSHIQVNAALDASIFRVPGDFAVVPSNQSTLQSAEPVSLTPR